MKPTELLSITVIVAVVGGIILWPVYGVGGPPKGQAVCLNNVRRLSMGLLNYSADNNDRLPVDFQWFERTKAYSKLASLPRCPLFEDPEVGGYAFNSNLSQIGLAKVRRQDLIPIVYESTSLGPQPHDRFRSLPDPGRHGGRNCIAFVDGHARAMTNERAKTMQLAP